MYIRTWKCVSIVLLIRVIITVVPLDAKAVQSELYPVCNNNLWTYIDEKGQEIWPYQWTYCGFFRGSGYALVCSIDGKYSIITRSGDCILDSIYFADEGAELGYYGGIDTGVIWLYNGTKYAFFDVSSGYYSDYCFDASQDPWFEGTSSLLRVTYDGEKYGYINRKNGTIQIPCKFQQVNTIGFHDGVAVEYLESDGKIVIVHEDGITYALPEFVTEIIDEQFHDDLLLVNDTENDLYGYCDVYGNCIIYPQFENAVHFSEGYAAVYTNKKWGHIDKSGTLLGDYKFDAPYYFHDGRALTTYQNRTVIIGLDGEIITELPSGYQYIDYLSHDIIIYSDGKFCGMLDNNGNTLLQISEEFTFDLYQTDVPLFSDDVQPVMNSSGKWGYINQSGTLVIPCIYDFASASRRKIMYVQVNGVNEVLSTNGIVLWESE